MTVYDVSSLATAYSTFQAAVNGDIVQLADGTYDVAAPVDLIKDSATAVVTFKAKNRGKVTLTGEPISFPADNTIIEGFNLEFAHATGNYVALDGDNIQLLRNKVRFGNTPATCKWFTLGGNNITVAHNDMGEKDSADDFMSGLVYDLKVFNNYFHDVNGDAQILRIGDSSNCYLFYNPEFAYNRVENNPQTGETETISVKCCGMNMHHNTFVNNNSSVTFRHGHQNKFKYNLCFNAGVRVYGKDNEIMFNQFFDNSHNQLRQCMIIGNGTVEEDPTAGTPHAEYSRVKNNKISYNIINNGDASDLSLFNIGWNTISATLDVIDNDIIGNIIIASDGQLTMNEQGSLFTNNNTKGNILLASGTATVGDMVLGTEYTVLDLPFQRHPDGSYRCVFAQERRDVGPHAI